MAEIRVDIPDDALAILDGHCSAYGIGRTDIVKQLIKEWSDEQLHAAIKVCRAAGINPLTSEPQRSAGGRGGK